MQQSQKYAAELAATNTRPGGQTSLTSVNQQATSFPTTVMPQPAHVQRQTPLPTPMSEAAPTTSSTQHPTTSTEARSSFQYRSSARDSTQPGNTKQDFIREFQVVCKVSL